MLPPNVFVEFGGSAEAAAAATRDLLTHSAVALVVIIALLMLTFGSWRTTALVLVNAPFALVGAVIAIAITDVSLSIGTLGGLVSLLGISARNSIMLMSHYDHLVLVEGHQWNRATAIRGAKERVTPILLTAIVTARFMNSTQFAWGSGKKIVGTVGLR